MNDRLSAAALERLALSIVTAYATRHSLADDEAPRLAATVRSTLLGLSGPGPSPGLEPDAGHAPPAVSARRRANPKRTISRRAIVGTTVRAVRPRD